MFRCVYALPDPGGDRGVAERRRFGPRPARERRLGVARRRVLRRRPDLLAPLDRRRRRGPGDRARQPAGGARRLPRLGAARRATGEPDVRRGAGRAARRGADLRRARARRLRRRPRARERCSASPPRSPTPASSSILRGANANPDRPAGPLLDATATAAVAAVIAAARSTRRPTSSRPGPSHGWLVLLARLLAGRRLAADLRVAAAPAGGGHVADPARAAGVGGRARRGDPRRVALAAAGRRRGDHPRCGGLRKSEWPGWKRAPADGSRRRLRRPGTRCGSSSYRPCQFGSRFSANAFAPSWASSEPNTCPIDLALLVPRLRSPSTRGRAARRPSRPTARAARCGRSPRRAHARRRARRRAP